MVAQLVPGIVDPAAALVRCDCYSSYRLPILMNFRTVTKEAAK